MTFKVWDKVRCIEKLHLYLTEWKVYEVLNTTTRHIRIVDDTWRKENHVLSRFELVQEDKLHHQLLGLPKYFVVKKDESDPLWCEFWEWSKTIFETRNRSSEYNFYWYDETKPSDEKYYLNWRNEWYWVWEPTLITLAERDRIVNKKASQTPKLSKPIQSCEHNWSIYKEDTIDWVSIEDMKQTRDNINSKLQTHRNLFFNPKKWK